MKKYILMMKYEQLVQMMMKNEIFQVYLRNLSKEKKFINSIGRF
jgi:hypothetical protein